MSTDPKQGNPNPIYYLPTKTNTESRRPCREAASAGRPLHSADVLVLLDDLDLYEVHWNAMAAKLSSLGVNQAEALKAVNVASDDLRAVIHAIERDEEGGR